jgi:hypothetical protein
MTRNTYTSTGIAGIAALAIIAISCSTAKISVNKAELAKVKSIAVVDFDTEPGIPPVIADECEEAFRGHFVDVGKNVVERSKLNAILKEIERSQSGIVENSEEIGRLTGAQALLLGTVTRNSEEVRWVEEFEYVKNPVTRETEKIKKIKKKKFFTFQVQARLVSTVNGSTIMTIKNERPERSYEMTSSWTLTSFREYILNEMGKDMVKALRED